MITLVQQSKSQTNGSSTTATFGSNPTIGNLLVAVAYTNGSMSNLDVAGWSAHSTNYSGTAASIGIFYKISNGTETNVTSTGNTICRLHIAEFNGLDNPVALDGSNSNTDNTTQSINTGSISTTNASDLIITAAANTSSSTGTRNWSNGFSVLDDDALGPRLLSGYRIVSATGSYDSTAQLHTSNSNSGALIIAFKESSAPPAGRLKAKTSGSFAIKPTKTKIAGSFIEKPVKVKAGGTFI